jgi:RNA polymerase subunit RPABC4/transcription elongation factor Spt4
MSDPTELLGSLIAGAAPLVAVAAVGLWLLAAWWTYLDMGRRSDSEPGQLAAVGWILVSTPVLLMLSLPIYLLARPRATAAQRRSAELARAMAIDALDRLETSACPGCGELCDEGWRRCPSCATWLEVACEACGRWSMVELTICPWCASERLETGPEAGTVIDVPSAIEAPVLAETERARRPIGSTRLARQ